MSTEPEWLAPYLDRKTEEFLKALTSGGMEPQAGSVSWEAEVRKLVRSVVGEMALHLTAPHQGPGEDPVREAREQWAAGS